MMLIIKKSLIIILGAVSAVSVILITAGSYLKILNAGALSEAGIKFEAEEFLFRGIILTLIIAVIFIVLITRSRNISRELDRLISQEKLNPESAKTGLVKLGKIGEKINLLYKHIDGISEMRGLKISALSNTAELLAGSVNKSMVIIDVTGIVIQVSRGFLKRMDLNRSEVLERSINSIISGIEMKTVLSRLEKKRLPVSFEFSGSDVTCTPIYNRNNEIAYVAITYSDDNPN